MTDEVTAQPSPEPAAAPAAPEPSGLEKVYQEFSVDDQAAEFQPQSTQPAAPQAPAQPFLPKIPDAFSPEFQAYQAQMAQGIGALSQRTNEALAKLNAIEQRAAKAAVEADIKQAVGKLSEKAGIDPEIAEVAFEAQARKDPRLLKIWNNRQKNPKALEAAIGALANDFSQKYKVRQDPQLVENQRAATASRQSMATTTKTTVEDQWDSMTPQQRAVEWRRLVNGG